MIDHHKADYIHRKRGKALGIPELIAIALGGMVGGGIFTILGISVSMIGVFTPIAIVIGGVIAALAAYSYIKLGVYYKDEGAAYTFFKRTFTKEPFAASLIGWWVVFGYISTLALYAYTFASYAISSFSFADVEWIRKAIAGLILLLFTLINLLSVKGMGKIEDLMVYTKLVLLFFISVILIKNGQATLPSLLSETTNVGLFSILIVASLTFVAYEGFELVINAVNEMEKPERNIPYAIYTAIVLAIIIYVVIATGAILAIPFADIIQNKEYALASGAKDILGSLGSTIVIIGALLATSSAISGTVFGASRQIAVVASDGYLPTFLAKRKNNIPYYAIVTISTLAFGLILIGNLEMLLEFGSVTFLLVSLLMAYANFTIRDKTESSFYITIISMITLLLGMFFIFYFEISHQPMQMTFIAVLYLILTCCAWIYAKIKRKSL